jgi:NAD(P)-dependent dehydrogenase (short-subunit alcohol dehydrogenase family)
MSEPTATSTPTAASKGVASKGVALVTGAAQPGGIGWALALRLADDGFDVAVNGRTADARLAELASQIVDKGRRSVIVPADVSVEAEVKAMVEKTVEALGGLDVVSVLFFVDRCPSNCPF